MGLVSPESSDQVLRLKQAPESASQEQAQDALCFVLAEPILGLAELA